MSSTRLPRVSGPAGWLLATYVVALALLLLVPSSRPPTWIIEQSTDVARGAGVPAAFASAARVEVLLNVAAFAPLTFAGTLLRPALTWRDWTAVAFLGSLLVEVVQAVALPERTASHSDVVANTVGALVGAAVARLLVRARGGPRSRDV